MDSPRYRRVERCLIKYVFFEQRKNTCFETFKTETGDRRNGVDTGKSQFNRSLPGKSLLTCACSVRTDLSSHVRLLFDV